MDNTFLLFMVFLFAAVFLMFEGLYVWWNASKGPEARRVERRLRAMSAGTHGGGEVSIVKTRLLSKSPTAQRLLLEVPRIHQLDRLLLQAGVSTSVSEFIGLTTLIAAAGFFGAILMHLPSILAIGVGLGAGALPLLVVLRKKSDRVKKIEEKLPDALDLIGRALRAGHAFPGALKMVGDEMADPIASEFRTTFDEINYGVSTPDALLNLATRVPSTDLRYFVLAVLIQRDTGGNLAELLDNLAAIVRARLKLLGQVRVLSAEGKLSAWILTLLPFATAGAILAVNPGFMKVLWTDPFGRKLAAGALIMMLFGILWMRKIIRIHI